MKKNKVLQIFITFFIIITIILLAYLKFFKDDNLKTSEVPVVEENVIQILLKM